MACTVDFRCLDEGFGGKTYKRKRAHLREESDAPVCDIDNMDMDAAEIEIMPSSKRQAVSSLEEPNKPVGRPTYDGVMAGKVSGRKWKQVRTHRASAVNASKKTTSFEQRKKEREIKKAYQERKKELKEEIRQNKIEKRKKKEEREKRKQENILRSGTKLQKITNPKTLKKIAKSAKERKLLKVVPDDVLGSSALSSCRAVLNSRNHFKIKPFLGFLHHRDTSLSLQYLALYIGVNKKRKCSIGMENARWVTFLEFHEVMGGDEEYLYDNDIGIRTGDPFQFYVSDSNAALSSCGNMFLNFRLLKQDDDSLLINK